LGIWILSNAFFTWLKIIEKGSVAMYDSVSKNCISNLDTYQRLGITSEQLSAFCHRWQVAELALFGSVLRDDFTASSDVDILVTYLPTVKRGLLEKIQMKEELENLLQRSVDLVSKKAIEQSHNWIRRNNILTTAKVFYVA